APPWLTAFLLRSRRSSDRSTGSPFPRLIPGQRDARDVASLVRARENHRYGRVSRRDFLLAPLPAPDDADDRAVDEIRAPGRSRPSRCSVLAEVGRFLTLPARRCLTGMISRIDGCEFRWGRSDKGKRRPVKALVRGDSPAPGKSLIRGSPRGYLCNRISLAFAYG